MPRKTKLEEKKKRRSTAARTPRPKPKVEFTIDAIDYKNVALLKLGLAGHSLPYLISRCRV